MNIEELVKEVNLPGKDNGEFFTDKRRRDKIEEILSKNLKLQLLHKDDYLLMYTTGIKQEGDIILISCHIDHVFRENELIIKIDGEKVEGTLDNSVGIATLLYSLQEYDFPENVIISFTGGEEDDENFWGAENKIDFLQEEREDLYDRLAFVLTIDVTSENTDKDVSIENLNIEEEDFENTIIRFNSVTHLKNTISNILKDMNFGIIIDGDPDESHCYAEWDLNTASLCIPCDCPDGDLHTSRCKTTLNKMKNSALAIWKIANNIFSQKNGNKININYSKSKFASIINCEFDSIILNAVFAKTLFGVLICEIDIEVHRISKEEKENIINKLIKAEKKINQSKNLCIYKIDLGIPEKKL